MPYPPPDRSPFAAGSGNTAFAFAGEENFDMPKLFIFVQDFGAALFQFAGDLGRVALDREIQIADRHPGNHVAHRADLTYVIGEMISELNIGHAYIGGGELPEVRKVQQGLLGAEYKRDAQTGFFQIARILPGENWNPKHRSPLTEVGVNVSAGEWIIAVNGHPTSEVKNINELLVGSR